MAHSGGSPSPFGRNDPGGSRAAARELIVEIQRGRDPIAEKRATKKAAEMNAQLAKAGLAPVATLGELVAQYEKRLVHPAQVRGEHKGWEESKRELRREYGALFDLPLTAMTDEKLLAIADAAVARGAPCRGLAWAAGAAHNLSLGGRAQADRGRPDRRLPLQGPVRQMKGGTRDRVLSPDEIARLWRTWEANPTDPYSGMFRLMLLTGQRRGEVAGLRWNDVDFDRREWKQLANKSSRPHRVPLSAMALEIIAAAAKAARVRVHVEPRQPTGRGRGQLDGRHPQGQREQPSGGMAPSRLAPHRCDRDGVPTRRQDDHRDAAQPR